MVLRRAKACFRFFLIMALAALISCSGGVERPFGVLRVGRLKDIPVGTVRYFEEYSLLIQRDSGGIRAMSTLNPVTLTPLEKTVIDDHVLFRDAINGGLFDESGRIQNVKSVDRGKANSASTEGSATALTHYRVLLDRVGGELEVLVVIGVYRPTDWRLKIPS
jgi:hypothetical protein